MSDRRPLPYASDDLLEFFEASSDREVSLEELRIISGYVAKAWDIEPTMVDDVRHDAARRASLVIWCCARHGLAPGLTISASQAVTEAWCGVLLTDERCDRFFDDYVLELLRRNDHLELDVQRDAWGLLYAELYARLRMSGEPDPPVL